MKTLFIRCKNALAYCNAGVVVVYKFESLRISSGVPFHLVKIAFPFFSWGATALMNLFNKHTMHI
jgi:hypothetical protein